MLFFHFIPPGPFLHCTSFHSQVQASSTAHHFIHKYKPLLCGCALRTCWLDTESWTTTIVGCVGGRAVKSHSTIKRTTCSLMSATVLFVLRGKKKKKTVHLELICLSLCLSSHIIDFKVSI